MKIIVRFLSLAIMLLLVTLPAFADRGSYAPVDEQKSAIGAASPRYIIPDRDDADEDIWTEDFEDGIEGWESVDLNETFWHVSDFLQREDDNLHWWVGDTLPYTEADSLWIGYDNDWLQYLDTPVLDLSEAGDGLSLRFNAWWLLEDPRIVPPGGDIYDAWDGWFVMISEDGGETFEIMTPDFPAYTAERNSAAERWWEMQRFWDLPDELPCWVFYSKDEEDEWSDSTRNERPEVEWVEVEFDLSDYMSEETVIRFALTSDRSVAAAPDNVHNHSYLDRSGVIIDDIVIADDDTEYLTNNADDDPVPSDLIPMLDVNFSGNHWALTEEDNHSESHSLWNDDDNRHCRDAITTPPIELPEEWNLYLQFWIFCDLPDSDSDNPVGALEDFWQLYVSNDEGETWTYFLHDYGRPEGGSDEWIHYRPGTHWNGDVTEMDLTPYAGETIQLQWRFMSDNNDGDGNGAGVFIDDIMIIGDNRANRDVGMLNLNIPYPTTVDYRTQGFAVDCYNFGLLDIASVTSRWTYSSEATRRTLPITPNIGIDSDEFVQRLITDYRSRTPGWTPTTPGLFDVGATTTLGAGTEDEGDDDQLPDNDSMGVSDIRVWPNAIFELGYDDRTVQYGLPFEQGSGAATRFSPAEQGIGEYSLAWAHFLFHGAQENEATFRLHVMSQGIENEPGEDIFQIEVDVPTDSLYPNQMTVPLYEYEELRGLDGQFWLWAELLGDDDFPMLLMDDSLRGADRYFIYNGQSVEALNRDVQMHAAVVPGSEVVANLAPSTFRVEFGEVYTDESVTKSLSLYTNGLAEVTITDVRCEVEVFSVDWPGEVTIIPGEAVTFEITYTPNDGEVHSADLIIESDDEEQPEVELIGIGMVGISDEASVTPVEFGLAEPYPNPFNNQTIVKFHTDLAGEVSLLLYDLHGREVMNLSNGFKAVGSHQIILNAESLTAGVYLLKLKSGDSQSVKKVVLMK